MYSLSSWSVSRAPATWKLASTPRECLLIPRANRLPCGRCTGYRNNKARHIWFRDSVEIDVGVELAEGEGKVMCVLWCCPTGEHTMTFARKA